MERGKKAVNMARSSLSELIQRHIRASYVLYSAHITIYGRPLNDAETNASQEKVKNLILHPGLGSFCKVWAEFKKKKG